MCYTPEQDLFFIGLAFTVKELRSTIAIRDSQIKNHQDIEKEKDIQLQESHKQTDLQKENYDNCLDDKQVLEKQLKNVKRRSLLQKVVLWVSVPLVVIESGYIALQQIIKKAQ